MTHKMLKNCKMTCEMSIYVTLTGNHAHLMQWLTMSVRKYSGFEFFLKHSFLLSKGVHPYPHLHDSLSLTLVLSVGHLDQIVTLLPSDMVKWHFVFCANPDLWTPGWHSKYGSKICSLPFFSHWLKYVTVYMVWKRWSEQQIGLPISLQTEARLFKHKYSSTYYQHLLFIFFQNIHSHRQTI